MAVPEMWHPQPELEQDKCKLEACPFTNMTKAIHFLLHAEIVPDEVLSGQIEAYREYRERRIRNFAIQMNAAAQMMDFTEHELAVACFNMLVGACVQFEKRFFDGVFENQQWRKDIEQRRKRQSDSGEGTTQT